MSEESLENKIKNNSETANSVDELIVKINRETNELIFTNPKTGKDTKIKTKLIEEDTDSDFEYSEPLSVEEFNNAIERIKKLGITWNTDIPPSPVFLSGHERDEEFWNEFSRIQKDFPTFPYELGNVVLHALLHPEGNTKTDEKAALLNDLLTQEYRAEFFFKYAVKTSYFEDIDWEVVVKAYEKGTERMPKIAYALLSLVLRNPLNTTLSLEEAANAHREPQFITVAVNESLIDKLMTRLIEVRRALEKAQKATKYLEENDSDKESPNESLSS